jgi:phosphoribosylanthranilate isomerase
MRVRIKICGITNPADAEEAAAVGVDAIGLNFYPQSPRCVTVATAREILKVLPPFVEPVALFVNQPLEDVERFTETLSIRTVQLHGTPPTSLPLGSKRWILAVAVRDADSLQEIGATLAKVPASAILVDAHVPGLFGGTGQTAPWQLLADYRPSVPLILAGGLTPENVAEAVSIVRPYAVDVAGGVESSPGKKDREKMRRFVEAVRAVACGLA